MARPLSTGAATSVGGGDAAVGGSPIVVEGTASLTYGYAVDVTGTRVREGTAALTYGYTVDVTGTVVPVGEKFGTVELSYGYTVTVRSATPVSNPTGWYDLVSTITLNRDPDWSDGPLVACPNDAALLEETVHGELVCGFDGWSPTMRRTRRRSMSPPRQVEAPAACPNDGTLLTAVDGRLVCEFDGWVYDGFSDVN